MTYLISLSFQEDIFPEALKTARVIPIFKKEGLSNYCPISILSVFSKLYEKCAYCRLYAFLTKYKLLFKKQFGFWNNHSTSHALISLIDLIKKYLHNDNFVCGVFTDLRKHSILLTIKLVQWLRSNILSLNETKTELIIFRSPWKHFRREPDIRINNYKLKLHSNIKYLGILIDEVLSWNKQIDDICTKLARANGVLSKLRHFVPRKTCISIFLILLSCPLWLFGLVLLNPT